LGGVSGLDKTVLREDGQWDAYLPQYETQHFQYFDSMACVSFSMLNAIETVLFRKYGLQRNFSDRFIAKMSGTTINGNDYWTVAETIRKGGLVDESVWSWLPWIKSFDDYYANVPQEVVDEAKKFLQEYKLAYEYVWDDPDHLIEGLKYGPLAVAVHAYCPLEGDVYTYCADRGNHSVLLYGYVLGQYWKIYDHYDNKYKKLAWDTKFWCALRWDIIKVEPTPMPTIVLPDNCKVFCAEGPGTFGLHVKGKMIIDDLAKLDAVWIMRNEVDGFFHGGPVRTITLAEFNAFPKYDLKNNPL
jgi:hypothetical protein